MADDLAFLFSDPPPPGRVDRSTRPQPHAAAALPAGIDWMTLREAHDETSIPISTLRKWAKRGKVRARLVREDDRELRLVAFGDVVERARTLERQVHPSQRVIDLRHPEKLEAVLETHEMAEAAAREAEIPLVEADAPVVESEDAEPPAEPDGSLHVPEGSILVPIDAWDRLLGQLGNLHEAGQQLADARERAAKAETEAEFLKERLREMRARAEKAELAIDQQRHQQESPIEPEEPVSQIGWRRLRARLFGK
jgi:hypothetical protein